MSAAGDFANSNSTVALPGHSNWGVIWWYGLENLQLDIVGFLAILGESAVMANAQVAALSKMFYLPRVMPAPQALIRTTRMTTLPPVTAKVTGVYSGNVKDHIHHVANILLGEEMPKLMVRCVEVTKSQQEYRPNIMDTLFRGQKRVNTQTDVGPPIVKAKATGPLFWVTLLGFLESVVLLACSIIFGDGFSILATILLSGLSTLIGISNKWNLKLPQRSKGKVPAGDVVIRYPNGSYLIIRCDEDIARELYFAPEEIDYELKSPTVYRLLSLVGTLMLMLGVIALANSKLQLQIAWAGAFIIINIAHWIAAALPQSAHWDLSCYTVTEQGVEGGPSSDNFTQALWKAILLTKNVRWVKNGSAAPETPVWDEWLVEAETKAKEYEGQFTEDWLSDPIKAWSGESPKMSTIWKGPKPEQWDPKTIWNGINDEHNPPNEKKAMASTQAV